MKIVIIGGSGHIGSYLVPRLVMAGHEVINVTRGSSAPYVTHNAWTSVEHVTADRDAEEKAGTFGKRIRSLKPDVVIDLICFTRESAEQIVEALDGRIQHFLHCGTIWVHGHSAMVPTTEDQNRNPFGAYGIQKAAIEAYMLDKARKDGFPATVLHPGHIVGQGWVPLNPEGHFNIETFRTIARGEPVTLPNLGLETVHHVHADDVAQCFIRALENWSVATGENFHVVSSKAMTLRGYAEAMYAWFGKTPDVRFMPWEQWRTSVSEKDAEFTWDHIAHSPNCSCEKAMRFLGYAPRYTSLGAVTESVEWLIRDGAIAT